MHDAYLVSAAGVRCPALLYGTAWKKSSTSRLVTMALGEGFRGIDTACQPRHYSEPGVGEGIAASALARSELYLQSKFTPPSGQDPGTIPYDPSAPLAEQVRESCAASLRNLRTDHLDALLLHSPLPTTAQTLEAWRSMEMLVASGAVRQLGISNCYSLALLAHLNDSARVKPAVLQNRFYRDTGYDRQIRAFCREHQILYQSFWTLTANPHLLASAVLTALASKYACEPAQVLLRFLTQIGVVPLTGTRSQAHMQQDLSIFSFELTPEECSAVDALLQ